VPCQHSSGPGWDIFVCSPTKKCEKCGGRAMTLCSFELQGKKAGQVCGQLLCEKCKQVVGDKTLCPAHARLVTAGKV